MQKYVHKDYDLANLVRKGIIYHNGIVPENVRLYLENIIRKDYNNPMLTTLSPRTPVPNLLLTGQSLMVHGIHGVTMTALMTCAEILGKETIYKKLNQ